VKSILKIGKPATSVHVQVNDQWVLRGAARAAASHGHVEVLAYASLTPAGAREYARRILTAAADADGHTAREEARSAGAPGR
jgi:hypothetical protein